MSPPTQCPLKPGVHVQIYRDAIRGSTPAAKLAALDAGMKRVAESGAVGVVLHGFVGDLDRKTFEVRAAMAQAHGLQVSASFGLGQNDSHNPTRAGEWMGRVALSPLCATLVTDAEGKFEDEPGDRPAAAAMGRAFRVVAPDAYVITQPWPVPTLHSRFPEAEFAAWTDADARQAYYNEWKRQHGTQRCKVLRPWFASSQATLARRLGDLANPQLITLQGYAWDDILHELVAELLANPVVIMWSDPFPTEPTLRAIRAVHTLAESHGLTGPGAVREFQSWHNAQGFAPTLAVDGICGPITLRTLLGDE